jgi:hypothetical protein
METFYTTLSEKLAAELEAGANEIDPFARWSLSKLAALHALHELRNRFMAEPPGDPAVILQYHKKWYPEMLSRVIYFEKCLEFERFTFSCSEEEKKEYCRHQQAAIRHFYRRHQDLIAYYCSGSTGKDNIYWPAQRGNLARFLACQSYDHFIHKAGGPVQSADSGPPEHQLSWEGPAVDLVTLFIALYELQYFAVKGKKATLEDLKQFAAERLNISLDNLSVLDNKNRLGKNPTAFFHKLEAAYNKRTDRLLDKY